MGINGNTKASPLEEDKHVEILIDAAKRLRDLVKQMNSSSEIKGYLIYREETEEEIKKKQEEEASIKELIKQNQGDNPALNNEAEDET
jgi:hypothetical protein